MIHKILIVALAAVLVGCAPKADVDKANAEVQRLTDQVKQLDGLNNVQRERILELEKINSALTARVGQTSEKLAFAEQQLSKKPQMPVSVSLRRALIGTSYVAVFATTIKQDFPILVTVKSKALATSQQFRVNLTASGTTELGRAEGASIEPADELILENQNYEARRVTFTRP